MALSLFDPTKGDHTPAEYDGISVLLIFCKSSFKHALGKGGGNLFQSGLNEE